MIYPPYLVPIRPEIAKELTEFKLNQLEDEVLTSFTVIYTTKVVSPSTKYL